MIQDEKQGKFVFFTLLCNESHPIKFNGENSEQIVILHNCVRRRIL
jgi:hypothetical protein